jgi:nitrite reductase (NADH) large subunit
VSEIGKQTSEGMVCGSCQPLLQSLLGIDNKPLALQGAVAVFIFSLFAITASILLIVVPGIQPVNSVQISSWEFLWTSSYWKQVTGFSLLALISIGLLMSLRKRAGIMWLGRFSYWRIAHTFLGLLALVVLLLHTGAHLGENINQWLMINFLAISAVGALAGISISWSAKTSDATVRLFKKIGYWLHVLVSWPLPGLLAVHIVSVYFF